MHFEPPQRDPDRIVGMPDSTRCRSIPFAITAALPADPDVTEENPANSTNLRPFLSRPAANTGWINPRTTYSYGDAYNPMPLLNPRGITDVTRSENAPGVSVHVGGKVVPEGAGVVLAR